jgi:predicted transcriptional regulator
MPRPRSSILTDAESRLMHVLWDRGTATVAEVVAALPKRPPTAYTTVQTLLTILEDKGYVAHDKVGRAFVFRPLIAQQDARRSAIGQLVRRFFAGSTELLVLNVLEHERLDPKVLREVKRRIEQG